MKRPDPKAAALSLARGVGASLAKPLKRAAGGADWTRPPDDYQGSHRPASRDYGAPAHDLTAIYPVDVYGPNAARFYGHGGDSRSMDAATIRTLHRLRGKPDAEVEIHRAVPNDAAINQINPGDWVTVSKDYARQHGEARLSGDYKILSKTVKAKDIVTSGDSIHEWGYDPIDRSELSSSGDITKAEGGAAEGTLLDSTGKPVHDTPEGVENFRKQFKGTQAVDGKGRPLRMYHGSPEPDLTEISQTRTAHGHFFTPDPDAAAYYTGKDDEGKVYESYLNIKNLADFDDPVVFDKVAREAIDYNEERDSDAVQSFVARLYKEGYGKHPEVTKFFDAQSGIEDVGEHYPIENLLSDNYINADEIDSLVAKLPDNVKRAYDEAAPVRSKELEDAEQAYGSQDFYMHYQNDFMRAAQSLGYDGVVLTDPSSTGESVSYVVFDPGQIKSATDNDGTWDHPTDMMKARGGQVETVQEPEREQNLKNWLGNSFLHTDGVPKTYYHGTSKDKPFTSFNVGRHGAWFTADPDEASMYARENDSMTSVYERGRFVPRNTASRVMPVYLKATNPFFGERPEKYRNAENYKKAQSDWFDELRAAGYDSWIPQSQQGNLAVMLGGSHQIKSAVGNDGTFDHPTDITKAGGGGVESTLLDSTGKPVHDTPEGVEAFKRWHEGSKAVDDKGKPLVVYRGEHGETETGDLQTRLPSITLSSHPEVASEYALSPNKYDEKPAQPRVLPAYVAIKNPIINEHTDPFVDLSEIEDKLGREKTTEIAIRNSPHIEATNNWEENFRPDYYSVEDLLSEKPEALRSLYVLSHHLLDDPEFVEAAKERGYDGAVHVSEHETESGERDVEYRVFDQAQVKSSVGNDGTWDHPTDITKARGGTASIYRDPDAPPPADIDSARESFLRPSQVENQQPVPGHDPRLMFHTTATNLDDLTRRGVDPTKIGSEAFDAFDPGRVELGLHIGSRAQAEGRLKAYDSDYQPYTIPLYARIKNPVRLQDLGSFNWHAVIPQLERQGIMSAREFDTMIRQMDSVMSSHGAISPIVDVQGNELMRRFLMKKGYDGVVYLNRFEGVHADGSNHSPDMIEKHFDFYDNRFKLRYPHAHDSYIAFTPPQVKSPFATHYTLKSPLISKAEGGDVEGGEVMYALNPEHAARFLGGDQARKAKGGAVSGSDQPAEPRKLNNIGLYSHAAEVTRKLPPGKIDVNQLLATLKNKGVKQDEIEHAGIGSQPELRDKKYDPEHWAKVFEYNSPTFDVHHEDNPTYRQYTLKDPSGSDMAGKNYVERLIALGNKAPYQSRDFTESHWPRIRNILAHLRTQEFAENALSPQYDWKHPEFDVLRNVTTDDYSNVTVPAKQTSIPGLFVHRSPYDASDRGDNYWLAHEGSGKAIVEDLPYHAIENLVDNLQSLPINWTGTENDLQASLTDQTKASLWDHIIDAKDWKTNYPLPELPTSALGRSQRVMLIDESQSDWGQKGREGGFDTNREKIEGWHKELAEKYRQAYLEYKEAEKNYQNSTDPRRSNDLFAISRQADMRLSELHRVLNRTPIHGMSLYDMFGDNEELARSPLSEATIDQARRSNLGAEQPRGPYVDSTEKWTDLSLKYLLHESAKKGFTHVAWTPASVQKTRYGSRGPTDYDMIATRYLPDLGLYRVEARRKGSGDRLPTDFPLGSDYFHPEELKKLLPASVFKAVTSNDTQNEQIAPGDSRYKTYLYSENDLGGPVSLGGRTGHDFHYDQNIPRRMMALAKQHDPDAKIVPYDGPHEAIKGFPTLEITPRMAASIKANGFKMFRRGGAVVDVSQALRAARQARSGK